MLEPNTVAIIRLAWERILGLDDGAIEQADGSRLLHAPAAAGSVMFIRLFGTALIIGPTWAHDAAADLTDEQLASAPTLLSMCAHLPGARILGAATLSYIDHPIEHPDADTALVTDEDEFVAALEQQCPADDLAEAAVSDNDSRFVLMVDDEPVAGAGYVEWADLLAHVGVLVPPDLRRHGYGGLVSTIAANDAYTAGLIPQWRARLDNGASMRLAKRLGFTAVGTQTTVFLS